MYDYGRLVFLIKKMLKALHVFHEICLRFLFEIMHLVGPKKEHRLVSEQRVGALVHDKKVQTLDLQIEKPTKGVPCKAISARTSLPIVGSGKILFLL